MTALSWLVTHTRVDVVSFSWDIYEPQLREAPHWQHHLAALRAGPIAAAHAHVTVVAGSDDSGPTVPTSSGHLARYRAVAAQRPVRHAAAASQPGAEPEAGSR